MPEDNATPPSTEAPPIPAPTRLSPSADESVATAELSPAEKSTAAAELLPAEKSTTAEGLSPAEKSTTAEGLSPAACGPRLVELFPALFGPEGPVKPLKLRIQADIQERAPGLFSRRVLGIFFSRYTTGNAYLKALTLAPHRFDLDGQAAGEIAEEHRKAAADELARRHAIAAERRAVQRRVLPQAAGAGAGEGTQEQRPSHEASTAHEGAMAPPRPTPRPPRGARPLRNDGREGGPPRHTDRRAGAHRNDLSNEPRTDRAARAPAPETSAAAPPIDPAQRERALLLRSFESSTLSKANFCALKRISESDLDAQLAQASTERSGSGVAMSKRG